MTRRRARTKLDAPLVQCKPRLRRRCYKVERPRYTSRSLETLYQGQGHRSENICPYGANTWNNLPQSYCLGLVPYCTSRRFSGKCDATGRRTPPPITERRYAISVRVNRYWKQLYLTRLSLPACRLGDRQFGMRINPHAPEADLSSPALQPGSLAAQSIARGEEKGPRSCKRGAWDPSAEAGELSVNINPKMTRTILAILAAVIAAIIPFNVLTREYGDPARRCASSETAPRAVRRRFGG